MPVESNFSHFIRALLAIGLTVALPVMLYVDVTRSPDLLQAYQDALAAVVAFYFGATSTPTN
jgi:hypothetical protein